MDVLPNQRERTSRMSRQAAAGTSDEFRFVSLLAIELDNGDESMASFADMMLACRGKLNAMRLLLS